MAKQDKMTEAELISLID